MPCTYAQAAQVSMINRCRIAHAHLQNGKAERNTPDMLDYGKTWRYWHVLKRFCHLHVFLAYKPGIHFCLGNMQRVSERAIPTNEKQRQYVYIGTL